MSFRVHGVTADILAAGLIASAKIYGVPPLSVFATHKPGVRKARSCTAAALVSILPKGRKAGGSAAIARLVGVTGPDVSPATLARLGITTDHLLAVVEAMTHGGLDRDALTIEAVVSSPETAPASAVPAPKPSKVVASNPLQRPRISNTFDPAKLAGPRRKPTAPAPARRRDSEVRYDGPGATKPFDLGPNDDRLVRECMRQGGFPRAFELKTSSGVKVFWVTPGGHQWMHRP